MIIIHRCARCRNRSPRRDAAFEVKRRNGTIMSEVQELESRIRKLPREAFAELREWFLELDQDRWDEQIRADFKSGKFNALIANARKEFDEGKAREL
jgi:hypothetical protein